MAKVGFAYEPQVSSRDRLRDTSGLEYKPGDLFLGEDTNGLPVGVKTQQHALTFGSAGAGKGAAILIPNLLRWPDNVLVIDPKGSNAANTIAARARAGHNCYVIDPYGESDVPDRYRATFNPLADLDPDSATFADDCDVIGDGLIVRSDPRHEEWYSGAAKILGGLIAFAALSGGNEATLSDMRMMLLQDNDGLRGMAGEMLESHIGTIRAAGSSILTGLDGKGVERDCLAGAKRATSWLDSPPIAEALGRSTFQLSDLKTGDASIYLVLPFRYLHTKAGFLRLFVQCAIHAMQASLRGRRCLFLLDEFYSLGRMDEIATGFGTMREYNLQIWAFMQDRTQLKSLYGDLAGTFLANSALHNFIGATEPTTVDALAKAIGFKRERDVEPPIVFKDIGGGSYASDLHDINKDSWRTWDADRRYTLGQPVLRPDEVAELMAVPPDRPCEHSVNVVYGNRPVIVKTLPYWVEAEREKAEKERSKRKWDAHVEDMQRRYEERHQIAADLGLTEWGISGPSVSEADRARWKRYCAYKPAIEKAMERHYRQALKASKTPWAKDLLRANFPWRHFRLEMAEPLNADHPRWGAADRQALYAALIETQRQMNDRALHLSRPTGERTKIFWKNGLRAPGRAF